MTFLAELRAGASSGGPFENENGLFAWVDGELELIVREGDLLSVQLDDGLTEDRTVAGININITNSGGEDGGRELLNDTGLLAFSLEFTDASFGIFTLDVSPTLGDYDGDGVVSSGDLNLWEATYGQTISPNSGADGNSSGLVDGEDFLIWQRNYQPSATVNTGVVVPEPCSVRLVMTLSILFFNRGRRRNGSQLINRVPDRLHIG